MESARRKLRVCLICVVLTAVAAGICYYYFTGNDMKPVSQGTLIHNEQMTMENEYAGK